ncbi:hypothetical protein CF327_g473 [Tilletia walkeri]|nr:hypothetical protein CF327_g473 [Tilletia walkeri]
MTGKPPPGTHSVLRLKLGRRSPSWAAWTYDLRIDEDFAFGHGSDAFLRASDGAMGRLQETAQAATGSRSETTRTAFPFLFPRFEGITPGGGKGGSGGGVLEPVRDERNPAYQLLFRDSSEGVSPSSEMVPPFRRTETM